MMQLLCFTVFDKAVKAFVTPFFCRAKGEALRSFMEACQDEKHQFARYASDYTLFFVGEFDDNTGVFSPLSDPVRLVSALECLGEPPSPHADLTDSSKEVVRTLKFS